MPTRIVLSAGILERVVKRPFKPRIFKPHQNNSLGRCLAILTYGKTLSEAEVYANFDLAKIENWAMENKIQFKESKSKAMLITRKRRHNDNIYLNNRRLEWVTDMKYLGIHFDSRLTFQKHI
jgi:hypothetical protein